MTGPKKSTVISAVVFLILIFVDCQLSLAGVQIHSKPISLAWPGGFVENRGFPGLDSNILYYNSRPDVSVYCFKGEIRLVFTKTIPDTSYEPFKNNPFNVPKFYAINIEASRMEMVFKGANPNVEISSEGQQPGSVIRRIRGNQPTSDGAVFQKLRYHNLYPGIDMILQYNTSGLEYNFIVRPGGKVSDICIKWSGSDNITESESGGFLYKNAMGELRESAPVSSTSDGRSIRSRSRIDKNEMRFETEKYDAENTLIIDPVLTWATYYGGSGLEGNSNLSNASGIDVTTDLSDNVCIGFITSSTTGMASSGAYQTTFQGDDAVCIAKFDSSGALIWATYFGGTGSASTGNTGCNIASDKRGNIYIAGTTYDTGFATKGAYQVNNAGGGDDFLAKFSPLGNLLWCTYYGGSNTDYALGLKADPNGNVFLSGWTYSNSGIATKGAFQTSNTGNGEAFIASFSSNGSLKWATYYGGTSQNEGFCNAVDSKGNVMLAGLTNSTGMATAGTYQTSYAGGSADAFLVQFDSTGSRNWATYFGGTGYEYATGLAVDANDNIYMSGFTNSTKGIATSATHQTVLGGSSDAFLSKFSVSGALEWATYYGGSDFDEGFGVATDSCGFVYLTGSTHSDTGIATSGAYQTSISPSIGHVFLAKFNDTGSLVYGTYYAGNQTENGYGIAIDSKKDIYISGQTSSTSGIATSSGYQTSFGGNEDAFLAKFSQGQPFIPAGKAQTIYCPGDSAILGNAEIKGTEYVWTSDPPGFTSKASNPIVKPKVSTNYYLTAYPYDDCPSYDSVFVTVINFSTIHPARSEGICSGDSIKLGNTGIKGYSYLWTSNPAGFHSSSPNPSVSPLDSTYYYLTETNNTTGCNLMDTEYVTINPVPHPVSGTNQTICQGQSIKIGYSGANGDGYTWVSNPVGFTSSIPDPVVNPAQTTNYKIVETNTFGCGSSAMVEITVNPIPSNPKLLQTDSICAGNSITLLFNPVKEIKYTWTSLPSGYSSSDSAITVSPTRNTGYILHQAFQATGCERQDTEYVIVVPVPTPSIQGDTETCGISAIGTYTVVNDSDVKYLWSVNGGAIQFGQGTSDPGINLNRYGMDTISLIEISANGCFGMSTLNVSVNTLPHAGLIYKKQACQFESINFKDSSTNTIKETLDFGDGSPILVLPSPFFGVTHAYQNPGNYIITQVVYAQNGCPGGDYYKITIDSVPVLNWVVKVDTGRSIVFSESNLDYSSYEWKFGDNDSTHSQNGVHAYLRNGDYDLSLLVTSDKGCSAFFDSTLHINPIYSKNSVSVYPNPFWDELEIGYTLSGDSHVTAELNDAIGRKLGNLFDKQQSNGKYNLILSAIVQTIPPGVYFIRILINNLVFVEKVVKT